MKKEKSPSKISLPEMTEAIERSGYPMEQRVTSVIESKGFYVDSNPVYLDQQSGKSREYDFSAITGTKLFRDREEFSFLFTYLIGECLNNLQPIVFFASLPDIAYLKISHLKCVGIPCYFIKSSKTSREIPFTQFFEMETFHH